MDQRDIEVTALCDGATALTRMGNRIASMALLWAAVGIAPTHLRAHRNLAAALANNGDVDAAAEEYARFVEFMLKAGEFQRAAMELVYANSSIGQHPSLVKAGREMIPLAAIADTLALPAAAIAAEVRQLAPVATAAPMTAMTATAQTTATTPDAAVATTTEASVEVRLERTPLLGLPIRTARLAAAGLMTALATVTASNLFALVAFASH